MKVFSTTLFVLFFLIACQSPQSQVELVNHDLGQVIKDYQHFKDKTGIWKSLDHGDKERRKNYLSRASGIKDGQGNLTKNNPLSPNYHAIRILW